MWPDAAGDWRDDAYDLGATSKSDVADEARPADCVKSVASDLFTADYHVDPNGKQLRLRAGRSFTINAPSAGPTRRTEPSRSPKSANSFQLYQFF
jgi:hypothetical protein